LLKEHLLLAESNRILTDISDIYPALRNQGSKLCVVVLDEPAGRSERATKKKNV